MTPMSDRTLEQSTSGAGAEAPVGDSDSGSHLSSRARASAIARESLVSDARRDGDNNQLHISADSMRMSVNIRYRNGAAIEKFDWDMHDLWHTYYLAAKHTAAHNPAQDRLVLQLVTLKGQGVLTRASTTRDGGAAIAGTEEAVTPGGRIWADLPFLVGDMTAYWIDGFAQMSTAQRFNFAQFLARLASVDLVADDALCGIGLMILRDALETPRPLGEMQSPPGQQGGGDEGDGEGEDSQRTNRDVTIAALLPCANAWLFYAGAKLLQLSDQSWNGGTPENSVSGKLLGRDTVGFSPGRWLYWLGRLGEISSAAASHSPHLASYAARMVGNMSAAADEAQDTSSIKRAVWETLGAAHVLNTTHF